MLTRVHWCVLPLIVTSVATAQQGGGYSILYGLRANGDTFGINPSSGQATLLGNCGYEANAAVGQVIDNGRWGYASYIYAAGGAGAGADQIVSLSGAGSVLSTIETSGRPTEYNVRGLALVGSTFVVVLHSDAPGAVDLLAQIDTSGVYSVLGPTGRTDLRGLAWSPLGVLYALGTGGGGTLCVVTLGTGVATPIGGGGFGDAHAIGFASGGQLLACGSNLLAVNTATGATTVIGPTGVSGITGLAILNFCYADCAAGGAPPRLNVQDFSCFLQRFAYSASLSPAEQVVSYPNCDGSTAAPVLNVADFTCFLQRFAEGCPI
jgi:hypothetical protein